jgi:hypothetical protein
MLIRLAAADQSITGDQEARSIGGNCVVRGNSAAEQLISLLSS